MVVKGDGPSLIGRDWLTKLKLNTVSRCKQKAISVRSRASVSSECACNDKMLFKRSSIMVDLRYDLI